ncbi:ArsR/SmtB family transcription factor [Leekyejoonella antrihumi]|uniref:Helix-turn-helix transcriptional regulator n=1 Tax=Leekyejoonella antrihumi TaxID=1660198 RepID=A0A563E4Z4_9MICO|nr:helix-turn-helix domain-containing protein [Leekyejoonella antrihumi]TWP37359.1 helix-turn-helix transcriptional regulator [Leekyejoonella antrihumi]
MPRRPADERHADSRPTTAADETTALIDDLVALHHPTRRMLYDALLVHGPMPVGQIAELTGLAVGSVSHHLKPLHRTGFIEPAPDLARDTRESWWRHVPRRLSWSSDDYEPGTAAHQVTETAEQLNTSYNHRARRQWQADRQHLPQPWRTLGLASDSLVMATPEQFRGLGARLEDLLKTWRQECLEDEKAHPDADRRPVRFVGTAFPSGPVRPGPRS